MPYTSSCKETHLAILHFLRVRLGHVCALARGPRALGLHQVLRARDTLSLSVLTAT
jgi:hypothetical protein